MTPSDPDRPLVLPKGPGDDLLPASAAFYLSYHKDIDAWAKLKDDASQAITAWLHRYVASEISVAGWTHVAHDKACWFGPIGHEQVVHAGIGWDDPAHPDVPYSGIWTRDNAIAEAARSHRFEADKGPPFQVESGSIPVWRYIELGDGWWGDLKRASGLLIDETNLLINQFRGVIEAALAAR